MPLPHSWALASVATIAEINPRSFCILPAAAQLSVHFVPMSAVREEFGGIDTSLSRPLADVQQGYTSFLTNDVLFAKITPCMENGKLAIVPSLPHQIAFGSTEFHVLRATSATYPAWLAYFLSQTQFRKFARQNMTGSAGQMRVATTWLSSTSIPVAPIAEQARILEKIAELLSDLDDGVAELKAAQKKLLRYRQSLLKAAVDGTLTAAWRETQRQQQGEPQESGAQLLERILTERRARWEAKQLIRFAEQGRTPPKGWKAKYPEPQRPDLTRLPNLPEGWVWASVDQCVVDETAITDGPFGSNLKSSHYRETGPRVIRLQNIGDGVFLDARAHISDEHYDQLLKHSVAAGDLVVAMLGEVLPRACIVPPGVSPAIVKADCARLRLNTDLLRPAVMNAALNSPPVRERTVSLMKGIGRPRINLGALRSIAVPVSPSLEQIALEDQLAEAEASIEEMHSTIYE
jgi:type I restriction enzyme, S subunit